MRYLVQRASASLLLFLFLHAAMPAQIVIGDTQADTSTLASGLDTPWEILWGPDDHIWFTERYGRISRLDPESGERTELLTIGEVHEQSESGLLGMALHPDFPETPHVFLVYNYLESSSIRERLVRYTYSEETLHSPLILLDNVGGAGNHNGSRLAIGPDSKLYMTTGDAVNTSTSQDLNSLNGKVLRMNLDGSVPDDNPLQGSLVWSWGHRNPQGLVFAPSGMAYSSEHGPNSDDEVNIIRKGGNYGWPEVRGFCDQVTEESFCSDSVVVEPITAWTPTLAVAGTDYYPHAAFPDWHHSLLVTSLKASSLTVLSLSGDGESITGEQTYFANWFGRLRDLCVSPDGRVFIATSNRDGRGSPGPADDRIVELSPSASTRNGPSTKGKELFRLYPNPVTGQEVTFYNERDARVSVAIFTAEGRELGTTEVSGNGSKRITLPPTRGIYLFRISTDQGIYFRRILKTGG